MNTDKKYCEICGNVTIMSTMTGEIMFDCSACKNSKKGDAEDTLIQSTTEVKDMDKYKILIQYGRYDITNPSIKKDCPKCKSNIMKYIRIQSTQKRVLICPKCDYSEM